jgi:hypothetical protein
MENMAEENAGTVSPEDEARLKALEEETQRVVNNAISKIESAIEAWKAAGEKPDEIRDSIMVLNKFYDDLVGWQRKSLMERESIDFDSRISRLRRFVDMCRKHEKDILGAG